MTPILILALLAPARPKPVDYVKLLNDNQQIINQLTQENQKLKTLLYGSPGDKVAPRWVNEQPTCPVTGFELKWVVEDNLVYGHDYEHTKDFKPYCVRTK